MTATDVLLEIKNLKKYFAMGSGEYIHAVDDVSLSVLQKEIVGLVGESGSGKSTLGKTILGLHSKTAGEIFYRGEALPKKYKTSDYRQFASRMQMIFQDPYSSLNPRMTVGEIIGEGIRLNRTFKLSEVKDRVAVWLERVGLQADHMSRYPHEFSEVKGRGLESRGH